MSVDVSTIGQGKGVTDFALDQERALMLMANVGHQLGVAKPTISHDDRRRQSEPALGTDVESPINHRASPLEFVPARRARPAVAGPPNGKVDRHHQLAVANDHHQ